MRRIIRVRNILLCGIFTPTFETDIDFEKYKEARGLFIEEPWERVKTIFSKDNYGNFHPELLYALHTAQFGGLSGALIGGVIEAKKSTENFFRTNDANIYANKRQAIVALQTQAALGTVKGALRWAPPMAFFCGSFSLISSCCELYRNKIDVLDNVIAGASCGAFYKFMFGIKGMISGGLFGGLLGGVYGLTFWALSKISHTDTLEIKYAQFTFSRHLQEKNYSKSAPVEKDEFVLKTGIHVKHIPDPLNVIEEVQEEPKKDVNETQKK